MTNTQMANQLPQALSGQELLIYILEKVVLKVGNCHLVRQKLVDKQPKYPFVTFNWITLQHNETTDYLAENEYYSVVIQLDIHDSDYLSALSLAKKLYNGLRRDKYKLCFRQANMAFTTSTDIEDRTTAPEVNYDYDFGFDCTFTINGSKEFNLSELNFDFEETEITSVGITRKSNGQDKINISK